MDAERPSPCRITSSNSARAACRRPKPTAASTPAAFHRNHAAIWAGAVDAFLHGRTGDVLEIGSGTGQHAVEFARQSAGDHLVADRPQRQSPAQHRGLARPCEARQPAGAGRGSTPAQADWRLAERGLPPEFVAMFCANVIHIAPWAVAEGLFAGAGRHLRADGRLFLYGPFRRDGVHNAPSNAAFDESLRRDNPEWGVRDTADLRTLARANGLRLVEIVEMPSNNAILMFEQSWPRSPPDHSGLKFIATPLMQ